jgi:hypothetical protein
MSTTCGSCGFTAEADDLFCGNCGGTVTTGQAAPPADPPLPLADDARTSGPPNPDSGPTRGQSRPRHAGGEAYQVQEQPSYTAPPPPAAGYPGQPAAGYPPLAQAGADSRGFLAALFDFSFTSYVTPKVIRVLYILAVIGLGLFSFLIVVGGFFLGGPLVGLLALVIVAPLYFFWSLALYRITLEFFVVIFRIAEDIRALRLRGEIR